MSWVTHLSTALLNQCQTSLIGIAVIRSRGNRSRLKNDGWGAWLSGELSAPMVNLVSVYVMH